MLSFLVQKKNYDSWFLCLERNLTQKALEGEIGKFTGEDKLGFEKEMRRINYL